MPYTINTSPRDVEDLFNEACNSSVLSGRADAVQHFAALATDDGKFNVATVESVQREMTETEPEDDEERIYRASYMQMWNYLCVFLKS